MLKNLILILLLIILSTNINAQEICISQGAADSLVVSIKKAELYKQLSIEQDTLIKNQKLQIETKNNIILIKDSVLKLENNKFELCETKRKEELSLYNSGKLKTITLSFGIGFIAGIFTTILF